MSSPTFALLMFNRNEAVGILRNARDLQAYVDEIVVIDSSDPSVHESFLRQAAEFDVRVIRALPLDNTDVLRSFGCANVEAEYVIVLDADEEASATLAADLRSLTVHEAYLVPEWEEGLRCYSYHPRVFRKDAVRFRGRSFDFPEVRGTMGRLDRDHCILHHAGYDRFFLEKPWRANYFEIEDYERPYAGEFLSDALAIRVGERRLRLPLSRAADDDGRLGSPVAVTLAEGLRFVATVLTGGGWRAARFRRRYNLARYRRFASLDPEERRRRISIARALREQGDMVHFLGLDDPDYVRQLTRSYDWATPPIHVYRALIEHRIAHGRPLESLRHVT